MKTLYQITTTYACAGVVVNGKGKVVDAAPIFKWMIDKDWPVKWAKIVDIKECKSLMSRTITGIVNKTFEKDWTDQRSGNDIVLRSFTLEGDKRFFRTGTTDVGINSGDAVRFAYEGNNVDTDSVEIVDESEVEQAPKPRGRPSGGRGRPASSSSSGSRAPAQKEDWNARGEYWQNKEKRDIEVVEPRINLSASQRDAIAVVNGALAAGALSFGNAAKGKQLDMILDFVDQITMRFYKQRLTAGSTNLDVGAEEPADFDDDDYEG